MFYQTKKTIAHNIPSRLVAPRQAKYPTTRRLERVRYAISIFRPDNAIMTTYSVCNTAESNKPDVCGASRHNNHRQKQYLIPETRYNRESKLRSVYGHVCVSYFPPALHGLRGEILIIISVSRVHRRLNGRKADKTRRRHCPPSVFCGFRVNALGQSHESCRKYTV